jgi:hypothetical protein
MKQTGTLLLVALVLAFVAPQTCDACWYYWHLHRAQKIQMLQQLYGLSGGGSAPRVAGGGGGKGGGGAGTFEDVEVKDGGGKGNGDKGDSDKGDDDKGDDDKGDGGIGGGRPQGDSQDDGAESGSESDTTYVSTGVITEAQFKELDGAIENVTSLREVKNSVDALEASLDERFEKQLQEIKALLTRPQAEKDAAKGEAAVADPKAALKVAEGLDAEGVPLRD